MPTYDVEGPDGKKYRVDGPAGATHEQIIGKVREHLAAQPDKPEPQASTLGEIAKGAARGPFDYTGAALGAAQDLVTGRYPRQIAADIYHAIRGEDVDLDFWPTNYGDKMVQELGIEPSAHATTSQAVAGNVAETLTNPASWAGPGGPIIKTLSAIGSGIGSELLGEAGEQISPTLGAAGRIVGGAAGGVTPGAAAKSITHAETRGDVVPGYRMTDVYKLKDAEEIKAKADKGYSDIRDPNNVVQLPPQGIDRMYRRIVKELNDEGADAITAKQTFDFIKQVRPGNVNMANSSDVLALHNKLGKIVPSPERMDDPRAAQIARRVLREELANNLPPGSRKKLEKAMGDWSHYQMIADVEKSVTNAVQRAMSSGTNKNSINTMRQEIRQILKNDNRVRGFPPEAKEGLAKVIEGDFLENFSRWIGKMAPTTPLLTLVSALYDSKIGIAVGAGSAVAFGARKLGDFLTKQQIARIVTILRQEAPANAWYTARNRKFLNAVEPLPRAGAARGALTGGMTEHAPGENTGAGLVGDIGNFARGGLYGVAKGRGYPGTPAGDRMATVASGLEQGAWTGPEIKALKQGIAAGRKLVDIARDLGKSPATVQMMRKRLGMPQVRPTGQNIPADASRAGYSTDVLRRMQADKAARADAAWRDRGVIPDAGPDVSDALDSAPEVQ